MTPWNITLIAVVTGNKGRAMKTLIEKMGFGSSVVAKNGGLPKRKSMNRVSTEGFAGWANRNFGFNWKIRSAFYRHLSAQMGNERPALNALEDFHNRLVRRKAKTAAGIVVDMMRRMQDGRSLAEAVTPWVPIEEAFIISSGEQSGEISASFDLVVASKERLIRVKRSLKSAMFHPAVYLVATYVMLWVIGSQVLPALTGSIPKEKAMGVAKYLYVMGEFATSWMALLPVVLGVGVFGGVVFSLPRWRGSGRVAAENYFPYSFYRDLRGYEWMLGFLTLLRAGMPDVDILKRQLKHANPWLTERLVAVRRRMQNGASLGEALRPDDGMHYEFPNPDLIDDITSMNGFPDFPERMTRISDQWAEELERRTTAFGKALGLVAELLMYGVLTFLVFAINSLSSQMGSAAGM